MSLLTVQDSWTENCFAQKEHIQVHEGGPSAKYFHVRPNLTWSVSHLFVCWLMTTCLIEPEARSFQFYSITSIIGTEQRYDNFCIELVLWDYLQWGLPCLEQL